MQDRMTVASHSAWRDDAPPVAQIVDVWHFNEIIPAIMDNDGAWHKATLLDGAWRVNYKVSLPGITHWKPMP